ncbi:MAG: hypothetical protein ACYC0L_10120, partial [Thermoleophilia bacterium]
YAISVRRASALPAASFRFHLAMDTLAVRLTVPLAGSVEDLHLQVIGSPSQRAEQRHAWRTTKKANQAQVLDSLNIFWWAERGSNPRPLASEAN